LLALVLLGAGAELLVPRLIADAYGGTSLPPLNRILAGRDVHPVEHYVASWHAIAGRSAAVLAGLWVLAAMLSVPAIAARLAAILSPRTGEPEALDPPVPAPGRRRRVAAIAFAITAGSLAEIALDPPYSREHWPFSQYQMYSEIPRSEVVLRRLFGVVSGSSGGEIALGDRPYVDPFDHSRLWFSLNRIDGSPERERLLPIALRDCLERYESRRARGLHDGPRLEAVRLYRLRWTLDRRASNRGVPERDLLWEVRASTPQTPSR
jgi:hypothetical protein